MKKYFNTAGLCNPEKHYMVNIDDRLKQMEELIDKGDYFTVNRARQYGKTTALRLLKKKLAGRYSVFSISFEGIGKSAYTSETAFCQSFCRLLCRTDIGKSSEEIPPSVLQELKNMCHMDVDLIDLSDFISSLCRQAKYPVVLMIDEADQAGGQEVFLSFLGMLRDKYLNSDEQPAFQSVILAGIYDIKNLKLKIRPDAEHQYNSPWNTRADNEENESLLSFDECPRHHRETILPGIRFLYHGFVSSWMRSFPAETDFQTPHPRGIKRGCLRQYYDARVKSPNPRHACMSVGE